MRTAFVNTLCELAEKDPRVWLLCGDLGYSVLEVFAAKYPRRYVNVGVAEQNMTGVAAGLALSGKVVFTYSIANFPVMRCLEQIRNDVCYHNLSVTIVAIGGGLAYGTHGYTHHGVEDLAVMRAMPHMRVVAPADPVEARLATRALAGSPGPGYLRLGRDGEPAIHASDISFQLGKAIQVRDGRHITLISCGGILEVVLRAAEGLLGQGYSARVLSMPTLAPLDRDAIASAAVDTGGIVTVEEHGPGGLGSAVGETLAELGVPVRFAAVRLSAEPITTAGSQTELRDAQGLSAPGIAATALRLLRTSNSDGEPRFAMRVGGDAG